MSNPFFSDSHAFNSSGRTTETDGARMTGVHDHRNTPEQLVGMEAQYQAPSASSVDVRRMTYDDVIMRTAVLFAVIVAVGAVSWNLVTSPATMGVGMMLMLVGLLGGLVLGLVNSFKSVPSPALIIAYAVFEGMMLGAVSGVMNAWYPGIVIQAVTGTLAVFLFMLVAYRIGFRLSVRAARVLLFAVGGYALFNLVDLGLMVAGVNDSPWGIRTSIEVMGVPLGLILGPLAIFMAGLCLAMDFESIQRGVENQLPQRYAWAGAFGLVVTLVWLYLETLRFLAILRDEQD